MAMTQQSTATAQNDPFGLHAKIVARTFHVSVIGMGYVGFPLAEAFNRAGFPVCGLDVDATKVAQLSQGKSYIRSIPSETVIQMNATGRFSATTDFARLKDMDGVLICVPTPLTKHREPDMSYIEKTARAIVPHLRKGHVIVLESTTYPGTTDEVLRPILEETGLKAGVDFFLAYSPEREDPGNATFGIRTIPKVVGSDDPHALTLAVALYGPVASGVVPVSSTATAEAVKLTENIFRSVNIALVNELKVVFERMGIDIWEVIEAAKSKPFGYMPFYPGPGLGGHCIPIDPFYLTWKAHEYGVATRFIELAGQINVGMPTYVIDRLSEALDQRSGRGLKGARLLVLGVAYKKNVDDLRESPSLTILERLQARGAHVSYHDPYIPNIHETRDHPTLAGLASVALGPETLGQVDAVLIITDHDAVDYEMVVRHAPLVIDTRNATKAVAGHRDRIVKA